jgi:flavin-dependent dehydrogenase
MTLLESRNEEVDVVVVGAGPAGSAAAKRCAEEGLRTILLEKKKLPRDKVCSGLILGSAAQALIKKEFGDIPKNVLSDPFFYKGVTIYVQGAKPLSIDRKIPVGWRRDLDFWLTAKATEAGTNIYDGCEVSRLVDERKRIRVHFLRNGVPSTVRASYVIGADGFRSTVRRSTFPGLKVQYQQEIRECYEGSLPLQRERFHAFYVPGKSWFDINHKGPFFCLEVSAKPGQLKECLGNAKKILSRECGFDPESKPLWRDGCMEPRIHEQLVDRSFRPARGRVLLVGDAAGFQLPTSEGIGTALLSGLVAGESAVDAVRKGGKASDQYLKRVSVIIATIEKQSILANNSRYKGANWNAKKVAEGIRELMVTAMFEQTFSC